jgi:DNA-binding XRE family transcriptional regulator
MWSHFNYRALAKGLRIVYNCFAEKQIKRRNIMIGSNIRTLRMKKGMTQKALADQLFVSPQAISRWENNEVEPSLGTITELAKIFDVFPS